MGGGFALVAAVRHKFATASVNYGQEGWVHLPCLLEDVAHVPGAPNFSLPAYSRRASDVQRRASSLSIRDRGTTRALRKGGDECRSRSAGPRGAGLVRRLLRQIRVGPLPKAADDDRGRSFGEAPPPLPGGMAVGTMARSGIASPGRGNLAGPRCLDARCVRDSGPPSTSTGSGRSKIWGSGRRRRAVSFETLHSSGHPWPCSGCSLRLALVFGSRSPGRCSGSEAKRPGGPLGCVSDWLSAFGMSHPVSP